MKKNWLLFILLFFLMSCSQSDNKSSKEYYISSKIKKQIIETATNYITGKLTNCDKSVQRDGIINLVSGQIKYVIDPVKITFGLIDSDSNEDATITIPSYNGQYMVSTELLVLLRDNNKFKIAKVLEGDMKVLKISDGLIYVEIPKLAPDSPNYNCAICREVVKYKYANGDLAITE